MKDTTWTGALQAMQETGPGMAPRAGQPGMGAGPIPYAPGMTRSGGSGPQPRSVAPPTPTAPNSAPSSSSPPSMGSPSVGPSGSTPPGAALPPELARMQAYQLYQLIKARVESRRS